MKKGNLAKWIFCIIFVVAAGIFYLCTDKMPGQKNGAEMVLQNTKDGLPASLSADKDGFDMERTKDLGEIGELGKIVNLSQSPLESKKNEEEQPGDMIYVHVCGAVNKPGVYSLPAGSRIADAVLCAGDFSPKAARDYLNLAKKIADGQKIYIPDVEEAETFLAEGTVPEGDGGSISVDGEGSPKTPADDVGYVDINTAGEEEFMTLPGIGKAKAEAILAYRKERGAFASCEELMQVPGIKESIYKKLCDRIICNRITVGK